MREHSRKHDLSSLLVLLLFAVFAVCILSVLLTSADTYRRLSDRDQDSYGRRTSAQYITTKIRQADLQDAVSVRSFEGQTALVLAEEIDGEWYETLIYYYDGYLRELFTSASGEMLPEDGEKIMEANSFLAYADEPEEGQLSLRIQTSDGTWEELTLCLRSGKRATPCEAKPPSPRWSSWRWCWYSLWQPPCASRYLCCRTRPPAGMKPGTGRCWRLRTQRRN